MKQRRRMSMLHVLAGACAACAACVACAACADSPFSHAARASDAALATMRGGTLLPNGLNVTIGIDIQTRVNGELAVHTVLSSDASAVQALQVSSGDPGQAPITVDAAALATTHGALGFSRDQRGAVVTLRSDTLVVQHLLGAATGVVVANTADNRSIDTVTTIGIELEGAWPVATNAMFSIGAIAADAAARN